MSSLRARTTFASSVHSLKTSQDLRTGHDRGSALSADAEPGIIRPMPSPVGHALGGIAAGWLLEPEHTRTTMSRTGQHVATLGLAALGIAADLYLVVGRGADAGPPPSLPPTVPTCSSTGSAPTHRRRLGSRRCGPSRRPTIRRPGRCSPRSPDGSISRSCSGFRTRARLRAKCSSCCRSSCWSGTRFAVAADASETALLPRRSPWWG